MSETIQEPVTEQASNSNESEASVDKEIESPVTISESKTKNEMQSEISNDLEIDYLSSDLFSNIKQISAEDLSQNKEEDEIPQEEQDRYKSTLTDIPYSFSNFFINSPFLVVLYFQGPVAQVISVIYIKTYFLNLTASSEPPVVSPALYECAPAPASFPS